MLAPETVVPPAAFARQVKDWTEVPPGRRWAAPAPRALVFPVPTQTVVVRWQTQTEKLRHALYITTDLKATPTEVVQTYGQRGAGEVDLQADHSA
jgi:hypothetical protein